jgi:hypothetical protein
MAIYVMLGNLKGAAFEKFSSIEDRDRKTAKIMVSPGGKFIAL